jgi:hypothetical protein
VTVTAALVGLNDAAGGGFEPPDVQVAAGPGFVVEIVNLAARVWKTGGGPPQLVETVPLSAIFRTSGDRLTDPRVVYDAASGRWFASLSDEDRNSVLLGASRSDDPTAAWSVYSFPAKGCADQPRLGIDDTVVVLGADVFDNCTEGFLPSIGAELWTVNKQQVLDGAAQVAWASSGPDHAFASFAPVQSLSPTPTEYVVAVDNPTSRVVHLLTVDGVPPAAVRVQAVGSVGIPALSAPPDGLEPSPGIFGRATIATNDDRVLDSVWENGKLWFSANTACVPTGDTQLRACARIVELATATSAVDWSVDLGQANASIYYPAVRPDGAGNVVVAYGESSGTIGPQLVVQARSPDGTFTAPVLAAASSGSHVGNRYGDYFGAARDPVDPSVIWVAGETGADVLGGRGWSTAVASVEVTGAGVTPPTAATAPPPAVRAQRVTARAGSTVRLSYATLNDATSVRVQVTVSGRSSVVFRTTTSAATVRASRVYAVAWRPAKKLRGTFSFCVRSVAADGTRSAQSCAPVTLR